MGDRIKDLVEVDREKNCWLWTGAKGAGGYGLISVGSRTDGTRRTVRAHRAAYEAFVGPIPDGLQIDHLCRTPACVNPAHLEPVTCRENLLRGDTLQAANAGKTRCVNGHEFTPENTYRDKRGNRSCIECRRATAREWYRSNRERGAAAARERWRRKHPGSVARV